MSMIFFGMPAAAPRRASGGLPSARFGLLDARRENNFRAGSAPSGSMKVSNTSMSKELSMSSTVSKNERWFARMKRSSTVSSSFSSSTDA